MIREIKNRLKSTIMLFALFFVCLFDKPGLTKNIYVSPSGNDAGNGSDSSPYKTIAKSATALSAGDTVLVSGGVYSERNITPNNSGTGNAMIVFKPKPNSGSVTIRHPATSYSDNTPVFSLSNKSFIWIEGFRFSGFKYGKASIYINGGQGNVVIDNRFEDLGTSEESSWDGNAVVNIYKSKNNIVRNNLFSNIYGDGVAVSASGASGNLVTENTFINFKGKMRNWDQSYSHSRCVDIQDMSNMNNVFAFNYARSVSQLLWFDRNGSGNIALRNYGENSNGFILDESRCSTNVIQENIGYNIGTAFQTASSSGTGWTEKAHWINNIAYKCQTGFYCHMSAHDEFRNNIAFNNTNFNIALTTDALANGPRIFKNNLWFTENKTNSIQLGGSSVPASQLASRVGETGGVSANPLFKNPEAGDFTLQQSSPSLKAGYKNLDMGAYAIYGKTRVGWDSTLVISKILVSFDSVISVAERGKQISIGINLSGAASEKITVNLTPVAGDARIGKDFLIDGQAVTFNPGETQKKVTISTGSSSDCEELVAFGLTNTANVEPGARNLRVLKIKSGKSNDFTAVLDKPDKKKITARVKFNHSLSIEVNKPGAVISVEMYLINGKKVFSGKMKPGPDALFLELPVSNLNNGNYLLKTTIDGISEVHRIALFK
jgi:hypothetical protein